MASVAGRLRSLGRKDGRRRYGGWFRVGADGVIRGWVIDEADLGHRARVEVRADGQLIGAGRADRVEPALVREGKGDGRYGFAVVAPASARDGRPRKVEVVTADTGYRLMSKAPELLIAADVAAPVLRLMEIGPDGIRGRLRGGRSEAPPALEVWTGGSRILDFDPSWVRKGGDLEFRIAWPMATFAELPMDAVLATPGMIEGGLTGLPLFDRLSLVGRPARSGLKVEVGGPFRPAADAPLNVTIRRGDGGEIVAQAVIDSGRMVVPIPTEAPLAGLKLEAEIDGRPIAGLASDIDLAAPQLAANAGFTRWAGEAPTDWETDQPPDAITRGFTALPESEAKAVSAEGDFVRLRLGAGSRALLLTQTLAQRPAGLERQARATLSCLARASAPLELEARIGAGEGGDGDGQGLQLTFDKPWVWALFDAPIALADLPLDTPLRLELLGATPPPGETLLEIAAFGVAGPGRFGAAPLGPEPANFVEQGGLSHWPHGVSVSVSGGRGEIAEGWFLHNRGAAARVVAQAAPLVEGAALLLSAPEISDYCRLEARLDPALARGGRFRFGFEAGAPIDAAAGFQTADPFTVIERIFLIRRGAGDGETVLTTIARRVLVERAVGKQEFDFELPVSEMEEAHGDLFLAFDFARPFGLRLQHVGIARVEVGGEQAPAVALEDAAIAAQAKTLKGLSGWTSAAIVAPGRRFQDPRPAGPGLRWSWSAHGQGTIEVVVCVHDAPEETLACLTSLIGTTTVPHTVRIIDDASGADTRAQLEAFIADKPWMRLTSNPANLGYTASANLGIRASEAEWVILLNSDSVATPRWIEGLLECAAATGAALVGPVSNAASYQSVPELKDRRGRWKVNALPPGWTPDAMAHFVGENAEKGFPPTPLLNGFCTLIRREAFLALGGFNEAAFPQGYGEENDLCVRAAAAGYKLVVADHVYVHHAKSASFGAERRAELQKQAGEALKRLHPDIDFTELGDRVREAGPLVRLREKVRALHEAEA